MRRRTTIELDERLLGDAKQALGCASMRETVEVALRLAVHHAGDSRELRRRRQQAYLGALVEHIDPVVLSSDEMWR